MCCMYKYHGYGKQVLETLTLLWVGVCLCACLCIYLRGWCWVKADHICKKRQLQRWNTVCRSALHFLAHSNPVRKLFRDQKALIFCCVTLLETAVPTDLPFYHMGVTYQFFDVYLLCSAFLNDIPQTLPFIKKVN